MMFMGNLMGNLSSALDTKNAWVVSNPAKASEEKENTDMAETKLAKFEVILEEVQNWIARSSSEDAVVSKVNSIIASTAMAMMNAAGVDTNYKNFAFRYGNNAWQPSFLNNYNSNPYSVMTRKIAGYGIVTPDIVPQNKVIDIIKTYKKAQTGEWTWNLSRNCMIFWMFFLAALDDEIYNNELDSIIDIAYCMDFDEAMIRDWCRAVEYVMQGNRLQEGCDFPCETLEGARFFLHKDSSNSVLELLQ